MLKSVFTTIILIYSSVALCQFNSETEFLRRMDAGEALMQRGEYDLAEKEFLFIIKNKKVLPSDLAYLFGENSYHQKKYKQSINWLNKYIQLKGTKGRYYDQAVAFLEKSENGYIEDRKKENVQTIASLNGEEFDCGGLDKMVCPICRGSGVVITTNYFQRVYQTCPYSAGEGYLTCEEYNLFLKGQLKPKLKN